METVGRGDDEVRTASKEGDVKLLFIRRHSAVRIDTGDMPRQFLDFRLAHRLARQHMPTDVLFGKVLGVNHRE